MVAEDDCLLTRSFTVTTDRDKIILLSDFMNDNGIDFDRIDVDNMICRTDIASVIRMLEYASEFIDKNAVKPCEHDKARQFRNMIKKIKRKTGI